jgi:hypothetical protein
MRKIGLISLLAVLLAGAVLAAEQDNIVFSAGGVEITAADVEHYIVENTPPDPAEKAAVLGRPRIYFEMAEMLYTLQVLTNEAERLPGFDREQSEWAANLMSQRRMSKDYRKKYVVAMLEDVNWEATAKEAYMAQKDLYVTEETVSASHILIKVQEGRSDEEAAALAAELRQRALQGEDFAELAREYSEDPSAARNAGSLGSFKRGQMVKPFEDVVFAMQEPGAISEVVKSPFGYHVIRYHSRKAPQPLPFESVKDKIVVELKAQMQKQVWQDKLMSIRSASDIVVNEELLKSLQDKYQTKMTPTER